MVDKIVYVLNSEQNGGIDFGDADVTKLPITSLEKELAINNNLAFSNADINPIIKVCGVHEENQSLSETTSVNCFER